MYIVSESSIHIRHRTSGFEFACRLGTNIRVDQRTSCDDYEIIYERMTHDKKNEDNRIRFTLLGDFGDVRINLEINKMLVLESFDFYRDNQG
jgi:3-dehydroquinate synthetase